MGKWETQWIQIRFYVDINEKNTLYVVRLRDRGYDKVNLLGYCQCLKVIDH